jgi:nitrite reductase/ring-hydroxylating ferredoxin subunit
MEDCSPGPRPGTLRGKKALEGYRRLFNSLILHFRPRNVPEKTLRWTLTWGLGGMAVVLVFLLLGTGVLLKFVYQPFPDKAYESILPLQNEVRFGRLIRNIHHWSANALILVAFLHLLRVFFTGAFHAPRQFNWVIGSGLFLIVLFSNFTGYLLPWDQLAFWAITICTGMLEYMPGIGLWLQGLIQGGPEVGPGTLTNFYAIHTAILPVSLLILMPFHFWRIRKSGGLVIPRQPGQDAGERGQSVPAIPNLLLREIVVALVLAFFQPRKTGSREGDSPGIIEAGGVDKFAMNSVTAFVRGKFYLARLEDGGFLALSRRCTHLGCTVPWSSKDMNFLCPCHASVYDMRGEVVSAPAPRPLDLHRVFIENNVVKVDTNKVIKRSLFRPDQVVYPKKP